jgi:hypothetical protein
MRCDTASSALQLVARDAAVLLSGSKDDFLSRALQAGGRM